MIISSNIKLHLKVITLFIIILLNSCTLPYKIIQIETLEPSEITIPANIRKIAIYNGTQRYNTDSIRSEVSKECIIGLADQIRQAPKFDTVIIIEEILPLGKNYFIGDVVKKICYQYEVDGLIILDSIAPRTKISTHNDHYYRDVCTVYLDLQIKTHWEIYEPEYMQIFDDHLSKIEERWMKRAETKEIAISYLPDTSYVIKEYSYYLGRDYGIRICPSWNEVNRMYYTNGHEALKLAEKFVNNNQWHEAINIWEKYVDHPNRKISGRATFNIALAYEMEGVLWKARRWALKAYREYNLDEARIYANALFSRISRQPKLIEQMEDKQP